MREDLEAVRTRGPSALVAVAVVADTLIASSVAVRSASTVDMVKREKRVATFAAAGARRGLAAVRQQDFGTQIAARLGARATLQTTRAQTPRRRRATRVAAIDASAEYRIVSPLVAHAPTHTLATVEI